MFVQNVFPSAVWRCLGRQASNGIFGATLLVCLSMMLPAPAQRLTTAGLVREFERSRRDTGLATADVVATSTLTGGDLAFNPATMMRTADLRPGMKGFGLTVFNGIRPERFEAEVIGVRHKSMMAGQDIILCRLSSPRLDGIGVVAGMSGSPVYMDGKLIGAVGYGWPTDKVPLAGVTPVEDMLRVLNATRGVEIPENGVGSERPGDGPSQTAFDMWHDVLRTRSLAPLERMAHPGNASTARIPAADFAGIASGALPSGDLVPLMAPLHLSSAAPSTRRLLPLLFPGQEVLAASGGAIAGGGEEARRSVSGPGGPIDLATLAREIDAGWGLTVPMIEGDLNLAGVGTVSFRHGPRLVAFAHPMWGRGLAAFPAAGARINTIVHSIQRPFKIGESLGQIGMIAQDRLPAIGVMVGPTAPMFPVRVTVNDPSYAGERTLNMQVWKNREQSPNYVLISLTEALDTISRSSGEASVKVDYEILLTDGTKISKSRFLFDTMGGAMPGLLMAAELGMMINNPYLPVLPQSVTVRAENGHHAARADILSARLDRLSYAPGDQAIATIELRPWRSGKLTREFTFTVPETLRDGTYQLFIGDSASRDAMDLAMDPAIGRIDSFETLLRYIGRHYPENRVYLALADRDGGAAIDGSALERLPPSVASTLAITTRPDQFMPIRGNVLLEQDQITPFEIFGQINLPLTVSRKTNP